MQFFLVQNTEVSFIIIGSRSSLYCNHKPLCSSTNYAAFKPLSSLISLGHFSLRSFTLHTIILPSSDVTSPSVCIPLVLDVWIH